MNISDFLNEQYSDSALYMNYRSIPSYIDGLKNSGRKVVYTSKKKNLKDELKVSALGSYVVAEAGYLHGESSIQGTIVTLAQNYTGTNNLPILEGIGAFGTRHTPENAAPRYIFAKPSKYFNEIFNKSDDINLITQQFEGDEIEPRFYVPTIPLLLVNGCVGIGVGFASKVLNRSIPNVLSMIKNQFDKKELSDDLFIPSWKGFTGTVKKVDENKWEIAGKATIDGQKVHITELPISYDLLGYIAELKKLKENGIIQKYIDFSEDDKFNFEVKLSEEESKKSKRDIMMDLCLIETITENLTTIDENNSIREYDSIKDLFLDFYNIKIKFLKKRIASEIKRLEKEENDLNETYRFISEVISGKINLKLKKAEVEKYMKSEGYTIIDKLLAMPLYSITKDKAEEIKKKWQAKIKELDAMKKEKPESIWKKDLISLEDTLKKEGLI